MLSMGKWSIVKQELKRKRGGAARVFSDTIGTPLGL
jgi:hypothetical protein